MKCYNIVKKTDNSAELNLYGEVVKTRPIDWWTGKPVPGDFIIQDEIMKDLDELTGIDSLTVRINSVGGDYYAGVAIRNRIRDMGIHVDTVNDSLATIRSYLFKSSIVFPLILSGSIEQPHKTVFPPLFLISSL